MTRSGPPESDQLWGDLPPEDRGARRTRPGEPPDWALPAWDAVDDVGSTVPARQPAAGSEAVVPPAAPPKTLSATPTPTPGASEAAFALRILGVSEVTRAVRDAVRANAALRDVWVEGEVGRVTVSSAGHCYFTLKDERSQLACVFFRDDRLASPFEARRPGPAVRSPESPAGGRRPLRLRSKAASALPAGRDRRRHERDGGCVARYLPRRQQALAADTASPVSLPGTGRRSCRQRRCRPRSSGAVGRAVPRRGAAGRCPGRGHPGSRRGLAGGPVVVQRRASGQGRGIPSGAGRVWRGPRG